CAANAKTALQNRVTRCRALVECGPDKAGRSAGRAANYWAWPVPQEVSEETCWPERGANAARGPQACRGLALVAATDGPIHVKPAIGGRGPFSRINARPFARPPAALFAGPGPC